MYQYLLQKLSASGSLGWLRGEGREGSFIFRPRRWNAVGQDGSWNMDVLARDLFGFPGRREGRTSERLVWLLLSMLTEHVF